MRAQRNLVCGWFGGPVAALLILFGTPAAATAQLPLIGRLSVGVHASQLTIAEPHAEGDTGYGSALRVGFPLVGPLSLETRYGRATVEHANVAGEYELWEAHLGARYRFRRANERLRPFVEGFSTMQIGQVDRQGVTPGPDLTGLGAGVGGGANVRLFWDVWIAVAAEAGLTWLQHGRVENGDWIRLTDDRSIRTRTTRLIAGISWNP